MPTYKSFTENCAVVYIKKYSLKAWEGYCCSRINHCKHHTSHIYWIKTVKQHIYCKDSTQHHLSICRNASVRIGCQNIMFTWFAWKVRRVLRKSYWATLSAWFVLEGFHVTYITFSFHYLLSHTLSQIFHSLSPIHLLYDALSTTVGKNPDLQGVYCRNSRATLISNLLVFRIKLIWTVMLECRIFH